MAHHRYPKIRPALAQGVLLAANVVSLAVIAAYRSGSPLTEDALGRWWALAVAVVATCAVPIREGRRQWLWTLAAMAIGQVLMIHLLHGIVEGGAARTLLKQGLATITWFALLIAANPIARWLHPLDESIPAYEARAARLAGMALSGVLLMALATAILTFSRAARHFILEDDLLLSMTMLGGTMIAVVMGDRLSRTPCLAPTAEAPTTHRIPTSQEIDVHEELSALTRLQERTLYGTLGLTFLVAITVHLVVGPAADGAVVLGFVAGMLGSLVATFWVFRSARQAWQRRVMRTGIALGAYRLAARHTPLAFPEPEE